jgi:Flp pilus assembly protein TadD
MRKNLIISTAILAGALAAGGCTTTNGDKAVDKTKTASVEDVTTDIAKRDLDLGRRHFREANFGLAEKHFRKAVELNAANASGWLGLAASYDQLGRFDFADRAYEQVIKVAGRKPEVVSNQGYSYLLRGDFKRSEELLAEAKKAMPDNKRVEANLALLKKLKG